MKTKKYSVMMRAFMAVAVMFLISGVTFAQTIEERKGSTATYSVAAGDPTDEYQWTVGTDGAAPVVVPAPASGTGTIADPFVVTWTADQTSIQVTWDAGTSNITADAGQVTVQKRTTVGATCPSVLQTLDISLWSAPTAVIDPAETDQTVCSADAIGGTITINLTGAPDAGESGTDGFDLAYTVAVSDGTMTVTGAAEVQPGAQLVTSDLGTVTIPLPTDVINPTATAQTYTITLSTIQDDFTAAAVAVVGEVYTITVNPVPTTGIISSTGTLTRR